MENLSPPPTKPKFPFKKVIINLFSILLIILVIVSTLGFFLVYVPGQKLYQQINALQSEIALAKDTVSQKNLDLLITQIPTLQSHLNNVKSSYQKFKIFGSLPYTKDYYRDGINLLEIGDNVLKTGDIILKAIAPYQDFLGLQGSSTDGDKTTEDRINFLVQSVESLTPHLETIEAKLTEIETSLNQIDVNRYPEEYRRYQIRPQLLRAKQTLAEVHRWVKDGQPILTKTSWLLGKDKPRTYFLIFQNDAELRPTGGFWTAYGLLKVDKGKITPLLSDDIYSLDAKFNSSIPAPRPIKAYHINVPYFNLRDMNISPDFPTSIELFLSHYYKISGQKNIDAVIAVDTQVLVDLVKILGRVGVSGFGNFFADPDKRCDGCPQIIYQLEWLAGRPRNYIETDRKGFLGPLMQSILANAMGSGKDKMGQLVQAFVNNLFQKHLIFYFNDQEMQKSAELANIAGKINEATGMDYFHLNDANMSSAKTNLFIRQKIKHEIISANNQVEHKVTVTYTNPSRASNCNLEKGDLCLNAPKYRNWFRFFVPQGSKLTKMTGSEIEAVQYEELGKQVFEGFYGDKYPLYAKSSLKTSVQYLSPIKPSSDYTLMLQKQPGTKAIEYELVVNGQKQEVFQWTGDKIIKLSL